MSDNNFPCGKCGGSGEYIRPELFECDPLAMGLMAQAMEDGNADCEREPCPSCNKGRVQLAVKERSNGQVYLDSLWDGTRLTWYRYRPLTDDEVREIVAETESMEMIMAGMEVYYWGQQVVLIPTTN